MNELQRQAYLSALGIENYAPRWLLPAAPISSACVLPILETHEESVSTSSSALLSEFDESVAENKKSPPDLLNSIVDLAEKKKFSNPVNATTILQQLEHKKAPVVQPFSLSVYRPQPGFLIVDSRNTQLALPTDLLLSNILRTHLKANQLALNDEVLRWPLIENRFVSRTETDARNELQTWLAVESELRPISLLWLMGENAARHWLDRDIKWGSACWSVQPIDGLPLRALILPSLNELLQKPTDKAKLWGCLH